MLFKATTEEIGSWSPETVAITKDLVAARDFDEFSHECLVLIAQWLLKYGEACSGKARTEVQLQALSKEIDPVWKQVVYLIKFDGMGDSSTKIMKLKALCRLGYKDKCVQKWEALLMGLDNGSMDVDKIASLLPAAFFMGRWSVADSMWNKLGEAMDTAALMTAMTGYAELSQDFNYSSLVALAKEFKDQDPGANYAKLLDWSEFIVSERSITIKEAKAPGSSVADEELAKKFDLSWQADLSEGQVVLRMGAVIKLFGFLKPSLVLTGVLLEDKKIVAVGTADDGKHSERLEISTERKEQNILQSTVGTAVGVVNTINPLASDEIEVWKGAYTVHRAEGVFSFDVELKLRRFLDPTRDRVLPLVPIRARKCRDCVIQ